MRPVIRQFLPSVLAKTDNMPESGRSFWMEAHFWFLDSKSALVSLFKNVSCLRTASKDCAGVWVSERIPLQLPISIPLQAVPHSKVEVWSLMRG